MDLKLKSWRRGCVWLILLSTIFIFCNSAYCAKKEKITKEELQLQQVHSFMMKIENGIITSKDFSAIKKLTKSKDITIKECAIAILAQYQCEVKGDAKTALKIVAPYVLTKNDAKTFISQLSKLKTTSTSKSSILNSKWVIPSPDKWNSNNPELCVAFSKILSFVGQYPVALQALDSIGRNNEYIPRLLAAEGIGDIHFDLQRWEQSVESYSYALTMTKNAGVQDSLEPEILSAFKNRIQQKLNAAKLAWDAERYGPGFVAYRKARRAHFAKQYLTATLLFQRLAKATSPENIAHKVGNNSDSVDQLGKTNSYKNVKKSRTPEIQNFPTSPLPIARVYIEAAKLYGSQCLLKLANPASPASRVYIKKTMADLKEKINTDKKYLRKYAKYMTIKVRNRTTLRISQNEQTLKDLKSIPTGKKAEEKAIADLNNFIKDDSAGLYRGEANLLIAEQMMEQKLDPTATEKALKQAQKWFNNSDNIQKALAKLAVPSKAWSVTAPPGNISTRDKFGNTYKVKLKPEMILNRNSCPWYMDTLKTKLYRMKGFIAFYKGNKEEALKNYNLMKKYDRMNRIHESNGDWGDYNRLVWGAEHGFFYANSKELAKFGQKFRFPVLVADYFYITEQFAKSADIHRRILSKELGSPSKIMTAYSTFMIGSSCYWNGDETKAFEKYKIAASIAGHSYTGERAMYAAGSITMGHMIGEKLSEKQRESYRREGIELLKLIAEKGKNREYVLKAKTAIALYEERFGSKEKALKIIESINPLNEDEEKIKEVYLYLINEN